MGAFVDVCDCADKICDQVSDAVLDACLKVDPKSKVACETAAKTGMILVFGEITTTAVIDYQRVRTPGRCCLLLCLRLMDSPGRARHHQAHRLR